MYFLATHWADLEDYTTANNYANSLLGSLHTPTATEQNTMVVLQDKTLSTATAFHDYLKDKATKFSNMIQTAHAGTEELGGTWRNEMRLVPEAKTAYGTAQMLLHL